MNHRAQALGPRDPAPARAGGILKTLTLIGLGGAAAYLIWPWKSRAEPGDIDEGDGRSTVASDGTTTCACGRTLSIAISPASSPGSGDKDAPSR